MSIQKQNAHVSPHYLLTIALLVVALAALLFIPISLPPRIGSGDLRAYWSSSYLLAHGEDFGDSAKLDAAERALTNWKESFTMEAWYAPWGNVILLPYALISFERARWYWLLTNIALIFSSAILLWRSRTTREWLALAAAFAFPMTLLALIVGQVNTLVLFGLALFLFLLESGHPYSAGIALSLTTIKPHIVLVALPLVLLDLVRLKQWRVLTGFFGVLIFLSLILFAFYPAWIPSWLQSLALGMSIIRETPTLNGLVVIAGGEWGKWIWLVALPIAILLWWMYRNQVDQRALIDVSIITGLIVAPLGWSYDQIMLLFPIIRVLGWMVDGSLERKVALLIAVALVTADVLAFYERFLTPSEVWYFWVPLVVAAVYAFAWQRKQVMWRCL